MVLNSNRIQSAKYWVLLIYFYFCLWVSKTKNLLLLKRATHLQGHVQLSERICLLDYITYQCNSGFYIYNLACMANVKTERMTANITLCTFGSFVNIKQNIFPLPHELIQKACVYKDKGCQVLSNKTESCTEHLCDELEHRSHPKSPYRTSLKFL